MNKETKNEKDIMFSVLENNVIKTSNGKYCLEIILNEENYKILKSKHSIILTPQNINMIEQNKNNISSKFNKREIMILNEISKSKTNSQIAAVMNISIHTVKKHISDIYRKLNATSRIEAIKKAKSENLIDF